MDVSCNYEFPNELKDIKTLNEREKQLWVTVLEGGGNLEPGDLMQIQDLNGTIIEVIAIRLSINTTCTDRRWGVKVLNSNNSQSKSCKKKDRIGIISVASSNLRQFLEQQHMY